MILGWNLTFRHEIYSKWLFLLAAESWKIVQDNQILWDTLYEANDQSFIKPCYHDLEVRKNISLLSNLHWELLTSIKKKKKNTMIANKFCILFAWIKTFPWTAADNAEREREKKKRMLIQTTLIQVFNPFALF